MVKEWIYICRCEYTTNEGQSAVSTSTIISVSAISFAVIQREAEKTMNEQLNLKNKCMITDIKWNVQDL